jgi:lipoate-protein ligase A
MGTVSAPTRVAMDWALLAGAAAGGTALHLYRFRPAALIGRHQWPEVELRTDWCRVQGLSVARRLTGGGALYVDEGQIGFTLALPRAGRNAAGLAGTLDRAAVGLRRGLARLGIASEFKAPNDLEVDGRKLASVFATFTETAGLVQGVVLLDVDVARMLHALRVPTEKLSPDGLAGARQRLVTVRDLLGASPDAAAVSQAIVEGLAAAFGFDLIVAAADGRPDADSDPEPVLPEMPVPDTPAPGEAFWPCGGGTLRARLWFDGADRTIVRAALAGDGFVHPADLFMRLARAVEGAPPAAIRVRVARFFAVEPAELVGFGPADLAKVLTLAADRPTQRRVFDLAPDEANALMVHDESGIEAAAIAARATVMLVPYCAKLVACKWRQYDGCTACGLCEVGDAYRLAEARGLRVISIQNYENLCETLARLKAERVPAYVGMCCGQFYQKRYRAFQDAGIPALLMNIGGANCYELRAEEQAYAGAFAAKSTLDIPLLRKVLGVSGGDTSAPETS